MTVSGINPALSSFFSGLRPFLQDGFSSDENIKHGPFGRFSISNQIFRFTPDSSSTERLQNYALIKKKPGNRLKASLNVSLTDYSNIDSRRVGFVLNHQDKDNYLMMTVDSNSKEARLIKFENGQKTFIKSEQLKKSPGREFNLQVEMNVNSYKFFINGENVLSARDSSFSGGEFGFTALDATASFSELEVFQN